MTHNENIKSFDDVARHLEFEAERLEAAKPNCSIYMAETNSHRASRHKCKRLDYTPGQVQPSEPAPKKAKTTKRTTRGKRGSKKDKFKLACYNCGNKGHFAREGDY